MGSMGWKEWKGESEGEGCAARWGLGGWRCLGYPTELRVVGLLGLLDGLLLISLMISHGMVYMTRLETCLGLLFHVVELVDRTCLIAETIFCQLGDCFPCLAFCCLLVGFAG